VSYANAANASATSATALTADDAICTWLPARIPSSWAGEARHDRDRDPQLVAVERRDQPREQLACNSASDAIVPTKLTQSDVPTTKPARLPSARCVNT
jgi:hypothetical protein